MQKNLRLDQGQIEVVDNVMAEVLRHKTPAERIRIGFGLWTSAHNMLMAHLKKPILNGITANSPMKLPGDFRMGPFELLQKMVVAFEHLQISYLVTGSIAATAYGEPRLTNDIDVVDQNYISEWAKRLGLTDIWDAVQKRLA